MIIKLIKQFAPLKKEKPIGTELEVNKELGEKLINEGIAVALNQLMTTEREEMIIAHSQLMDDEELQDDVQKVKIKTKAKPKK
jgi:type II secretory pathway component PulC